MEGTSKYEIREVLLDMKSERAFFRAEIYGKAGRNEPVCKGSPLCGAATINNHF